MSVCEFDTKIVDGFIRVPESYEKEIGSAVKVILLYGEQTVNQGQFFNYNKSASAKRHKTLKQRLADFYGENYDPNKIKEEIKEIDWGKPVGEEVW
jgi:hypothetical protein